MCYFQIKARVKTKEDCGKKLWQTSSRLGHFSSKITQKSQPSTLQKSSRTTQRTYW